MTQSTKENMTRVYVWVPPDVKEALKQVTRDNKLKYTNVSELIRHCISIGLTQIERERTNQ